MKEKAWQEISTEMVIKLLSLTHDVVALLLRRLFILHRKVKVNKASFNFRRVSKIGAILVLDDSAPSLNAVSRDKKLASVRQADGSTNFNLI